MAQKRSRLPKVLSLGLPAYHTVLFDGVPMWRAQAWALRDARIHGVKFTVNSAIRSNDVIRRYKGRGLRPDYSSQEYLYAMQNKPGFFPANKPTETSHCGYSDGNRYYKKPRGHRIPKYMYGIDAVDRPGGDAAGLVQWLNSHGYKTVRPYNKSNERHHFMFLASPANNARRRLAAHYSGRKHAR